MLGAKTRHVKGFGDATFQMPYAETGLLGYAVTSATLDSEDADRVTKKKTRHHPPGSGKAYRRSLAMPPQSKAPGRDKITIKKQRFTLKSV